MENDLNTMVQSILQNPEFTALVKEIKGDNGDNTPIDSEKIMAKLPDVLNMFGMNSGGNNTDTSHSETSGNNEKQKDAAEQKGRLQADLPSGLTQFLKPGSQDKRNKLLCALKPYLSPARCSLIDKAMNAMQLGEVLGVMQSVQTNGTDTGNS